MHRHACSHAAHTQTDAHVSTHRCTRPCIHICACTHPHTHRHTSIHTCTYVYMHTHPFTHTPALLRAAPQHSSVPHTRTWGAGVHGPLRGCSSCRAPSQTTLWCWTQTCTWTMDTRVFTQSQRQRCGYTDMLCVQVYVCIPGMCVSVQIDVLTFPCAYTQREQTQRHTHSISIEAECCTAQLHGVLCLPLKVHRKAEPSCTAAENERTATCGCEAELYFTQTQSCSSPHTIPTLPGRLSPLSVLGGTALGLPLSHRATAALVLTLIPQCLGTFASSLQ